MIRALYTSATGMNAQATSIDNTANNLANVNTNGFKKGQTDFQDLIYVNERTPWRTVALNQDFSGRKSDSDQVVDDDIGTQSGRDSVCGRVSKERRTEILVGQLRDVLLKKDFRNSVGRNRIHRGLLGEHFVSGNAVQAA